MFFRRMLKQYAGQIAYYACVALVLAAVALAAERFRDGDAPAEQLVLPAVELAEMVQTKEEPVFELHENMELIRAYADQPEWNNVHRQWETHAAADFAGGGEVYSCSDGVVRTVGKSGMHGGFVEVETDEFLLRYCSVEYDEEIVPGKKLKKGDILGRMDDSMPGESHMGAHLHLEVWENNASRNILELAGKIF